MPTVVGIGSQAQLVQGVFGNSISVQNRTIENVYVGSDSSVSPSNGWVLPGFGTLTWTGGVQLWACTDKGGSAQLVVSDAALQVFTPGPDHVTIDGGTVTIANASIPISGTVDIASGTINAVIDGPVEINGGTVNVGGAVTANNNVVNLYSTGIFQAPTTGVTAFDSSVGGIDMTDYGTLKFRAGGEPTALGTVQTNRGVQAVISQWTAGGVLIKSEAPEFLASGYMDYTTQIVAPVVKIDFYGVSSTQNISQLIVNGLTAVLPHAYYQYPGNLGRLVNIAAGTGIDRTTTGYTAVGGNVPASSTSFWFPETRAGRGLYSFNGAGSFLGSMGYQAALSSTTLMASDQFGSGGSKNDVGEFVFPETPIGLVASNTVTSSQAFNARFTWG